MARPRFLRGWRVGLLLGLGAGLLLVPLLRSPLFKGFEQKTVDERMRLRGRAEAAPEIVVCAIDERSVDQLGQWPWPRSFLAKLVTRLHQGGARAIVFDIVFSEPSRGGPQEDEALAVALRDAGNVVLGFYLTRPVVPGEGAADFGAAGSVAQAEAGKSAADAGSGAAAAAKEPGPDSRRGSETDGGAPVPHLGSSGSPDPQPSGRSGGSPPEAIPNVPAQAAEEWRDPGVQAEMLIRGQVEQSRVSAARFPEVQAFARAVVNIPVLTRACRKLGQFIFQPDAGDGVVRHYPLVLIKDERFYPALALRAVQVFRGSPPIVVTPHQVRLPRVQLGEQSIPLSEKGELWVNFRGPYGGPGNDESTFRYYSIADVLSGAIPAETFKDKLVFVGATEAGIGDARTSPFDGVFPGIEVHATVADNILHSRFIMDGAPEAILGVLAVLLLGALCGTVAGLFRKPVVGAAVAVGIILLYAALTYVGFAVFSRHVYLFIPALAGALGYTVAAVREIVFVDAKARQIRRTFQQFVSGAVVEEMLRDPEKVRLGGEKRVMTVLFTDIRGFTTTSEKLSPEQIVVLLNEYLTPMTDLILEQGGTIDKYMGDAIMAFFGAPSVQPDHAARACAAALAMQAKLKELNRQWPERNLPTLATGIGLNTGEMSVGNMGSTQIFDYTVIGDHVNLGSRLEGLTKVYGVQTLVSEYTAAHAREAFTFRELDRVRVKGKKDVVRIFELIGTAAQRPALRDFVEMFEYGLDAWRARKFEQAESLFRDALRLRPGDPPCALYLDRLAQWQGALPADDWDGVTNMTEK